jgi:membrane-associated phospholipid phosphatase
MDSRLSPGRLFLLMFQTELVLFLQSFETDFLNYFFQFCSDVGFSRWTSLFLLVFLFGISFRYGVILMQAMILSGLTSLGLKEVFALPRPAHVDLNVKLIGQGTPNLTPFDSQGAQGFFGRLPEDVVASFRANPPQSWGFPSGHTSNAMTLGGLLFLFAKKPWVKLIALAILVFVPLSRMYLGRHFLVDVLGGYVIGLAFVLIFYKGVVKNTRLCSFLFRKPQKLQWNIKIILFFFYMCIFPFLILIVPGINHEVVAALLGLNIGFLLVWRRGIPEDKGTIWQRIARILLALAVYALADQISGRLSQFLLPVVPGLIEFTQNALTSFFLLWGSTALCIKLGLYRQRTPLSSNLS